MGWVVCTASAALVSSVHYGRYPGARARTGVHDVFAAALADCLLLHCDGVADSRDPYCELHVSELPGSGAGLPAAGRSVHVASHAGPLEGAAVAGKSSQYSAGGGRASDRQRGATKGG